MISNPNDESFAPEHLSEIQADIAQTRADTIKLQTWISEVDADTIKLQGWISEVDAAIAKELERNAALKQKQAEKNTPQVIEIKQNSQSAKISPAPSKKNSASKHLLRNSLVGAVFGFFGGMSFYSWLNHKKTQELAQHTKTIAAGIQKNGEIPTVGDLNAMACDAQLRDQVLDAVGGRFDQFAGALETVAGTQTRLQEIARQSSVTLTPGTSTWEKIQDLLAKGMASGGLAKGSDTESARDVNAALQALGERTGIPQKDLIDAYTAARNDASLQLAKILDGQKPTSADYQQVMRKTLGGLDKYLTDRGTTIKSLQEMQQEPLTLKDRAVCALRNFQNPFRNLFDAPANAATPPGMNGGSRLPQPATAPAPTTGGGVFASVDALRVVGGVMACWGAFGALQAMRRKDADALDKVYYTSRIASGAISMAGISNPFTAMAAGIFTLAHLSRDKTLKKITENLSKNEDTYNRLTTDAGQMNQWQRTAQLAVCVASSLPLKASHALSTQLNAAREGAATLVGWDQRPQVSEVALSAYMQERNQQLLGLG